MLDITPRSGLSEEQRLMRQSCRDFVDEVVTPFIRSNWQREWDMNPQARLPPEILERADEIGIRTLGVPEEFGGVELEPKSEVRTFALISEEIARGDSGLADKLVQNWKVSVLLRNFADAPYVLVAIGFRETEVRVQSIAHGVAVSEVSHFDQEHHPVPGPDPKLPSYGTYASFSDPDGNRWVLQQVTTRLPGRGLSLDVATLTELFQETEKRHGSYEPTAPKHHWSGWYAAYVVARERGRTPDEAAKDATLHIEGVLATQA